ncbi:MULTISPECIES: hypothetical protein [Virgibacillus]|nr:MULTISPECIES: hypothetical protein [Virgibacillus]
MLEKLKTETRNEYTYNLDSMQFKDGLALMNKEDKQVANVIDTQL